MAPQADDPPEETAQMILCWYQHALPHLLPAHPTSATSLSTLSTHLSDGTLLADTLAHLDSTRLAPSTILRATPRNALSTPLPTPHTTPQIDARQSTLLYENNTRRVLHALKKHLTDLRSAHRLAPPPAAALHTFLSDVSKIPPAKDPMPAVRLAQVVIACAVHGPRKNEFRHAVWRMQPPVRATFMNCLNVLAGALSLPPADALYNPSGARQMHASGVVSPPQYPHTPPHPYTPSLGVFSPPGHVMTPPPRAGPAPLTQPFPYPMSPPHARAPAYQKPLMPLSPRASILQQQPRTAQVPGTPPIGTPPIGTPPIGTPPIGTPPIGTPPIGTPQMGTPQMGIHSSPRAGSPRGVYTPEGRLRSATSSGRATPRGSASRSAPSDRRATPTRTSPARASPARASPARASPARASPARASPRKGTSDPIKQTSNVTDDGVVSMARSLAPDTESHRLPEQPPPQQYDDGMGMRKFSAITNESGSSATSPVHPDTHDPPHVSDLVHRFEEGSSNSKRSSEEFYTPKENLSPARDTPSPPPVEQVIQRVVEHPIDPRPSSSARPPRYTQTTDQSETYPENVDDIVRQSVKDSVVKQFTRSTKATTGASSTNANTTTRGHATPSATSSIFGAESYCSVDFSDPRFMHTTLDAPSPSSHWNMSQRKDICEGILSPQPLFSPPHMPQRLRRSTAATQMTPPLSQPQAPKLFRSGSVSSQYSFSSAGGEQEDDVAKNKASSASTSTGGAKQPSPRVPVSESAGSVQTDSQSKGFSLPPNAGQEESMKSVVDETVSETLAGTADDGEQDVDEDAQSSQQALKVYDYRDEDDEEREDPSDGGDAAPEERVGDDDGEDVDEDEDEDEAEEEAEEVEHFSDKGTFEEVEEYAVYNSDQHTDDFFPPGEEEPQFVHEEVLRASSGEFDLATEAEGQTQLRDQMARASASVDHSERDLADIPQPIQQAQSQSVDNEEVGDSRLPTARASEPCLTPSSRPSRVTRPMSYSTPAYGAIYRRREVPPTPPSPPAIESLVRSFTDAKRLPASISTQPVSTMQPSEDLFQKLINVWQNTEDDQRTELSQSQIVVEGLPSQPMSSDPPASQSTQDSTIRDIESQEPSPAHSASRGRRPRAVRLPEGLKSPQHISSSVTREDSKSPEADKASVASFSDAFSSEDRPHLEDTRVEWEAALRGHGDAGVPVSTSQKQATSPHEDLMPPSPSMVQRKAKSHSTSTARHAPVPEDHLVKVDRRRLDWLTRQLLAARDAISRKDLQMTFAETERADQREILLLEKQDAESVIDAMKKLLAERENELHTARNRLSVAIEGVARDRASQESKTSAGGNGQSFQNLITEGHTKIHEHIERSEAKQIEAQKAGGVEMKELFTEVQRLLTQTMNEMTEKRDAELNALRSDLRNREKLVADLQKSSAELMSQNREIQSEASQVRLEKERSDHRYKMEMSHVSAQVELVNEFSKKLHDNFRETENLRQQVLHYQDKLSQITNTSGVSRRQIKELREAVTRANDECARLRREALAEKRKRMEAIRRAEELEDLRMNDDAAQSHGRFPDRMDRTDSGSFRSHEPVRPAGHNRPGGSGINARYHARARGAPASPTTAQRAWLAVKDKISGIVTGKDVGSSRRRGPGHSGRRDYSKGGGSSQSSHSQSRSRGSPRDEFNGRSRSGSLRSRSSQGSGSSARSGPRSNRSGGSGGRRTSQTEDVGQYMHAEPYGRDEIEHIRATDF